jgi:phosphatidylglycerophosphatase GEP4
MNFHNSLPPPITQSEQQLAVPHLSVRDLRWIDWSALKAAGFKACVFDKDNTLCEPFAVDIDQKLRGSVEACRAAFGGKLAIYSNSAGLQQYDPKGEHHYDTPTVAARGA